MSEAAPQPAADILSRLRRQDHAAFAELVRSNEPMIAGLAQSMGLRGADLEDATAEAFAEIFRSLPRYEGRSSLSTWSYRIACRVIWRIRTERSKQKHGELNDGQLQDDALPPSQIVEREQDHERLWQAVARLEPRQATVVELYYRRDCSIEEIAEKLNCPVGTIKTLLHRARLALRQALEGEMRP